METWVRVAQKRMSQIGLSAVSAVVTEVPIQGRVFEAVYQKPKPASSCKPATGQYRGSPVQPKEPGCQFYPIRNEIESDYTIAALVQEYISQKNG